MFLLLEVVVLVSALNVSRPMAYLRIIPSVCTAKLSLLVVLCVKIPTQLSHYLLADTEPPQNARYVSLFHPIASTQQRSLLYLVHLSFSLISQTPLYVICIDIVRRPCCPPVAYFASTSSNTYSSTALLATHIPFVP